MQQQYPQKAGIDLILKQAFSYWSKTLGLQVMFSIIYFGIYFTVFYYLGTKYNVIENLLTAYINYQNVGKSGLEDFQTDVATVFDSEGFQYFILGMMAVRIFLYPLNIGFYQIYRKMDLNEEVGLNDLFAGYIGINFFKFISFYIFWVFLYTIIGKTFVLPVIWVMLTIFAAPLMFFENKRIIEILGIGWKALKTNFLEIFVCVLVAVIFCYAGFIVFFFGILFTFPFWNAIIYSLYKNIFGQEKKDLDPAE
ncbi:DUF2189 domain-containing protein [Chryseobacterium caseinilyticum]|uniref:Beta-carotene 15,15'-monooxygenase n=1 Tax=Chryseobacterium caseinilyticum TaxID=2771428 RepID=A0ABR8ZEB6_9FLAO|nr:hypothetical protein [Chryseobacterium caseinilyticum]MBD8083188.1 hypothetical protein [Chryseobacterium caseinilyticum]